MMRSKLDNPIKYGSIAGSFRQAAREELDHKQFLKNLNVWKRNFPQVGEELARMEPTDSHILINEAGEFDIFFENRSILGTGSRSWATGTQNFSNLFQTRRLVDKPTGAEGVENEYAQRIKEAAEIELGGNIPDYPLGSECHNLVVFGLALADHLPILADITRCRCLIIVEPHHSFFYHSLYTFDWESFLERFTRGGKTIQFVFDRNPIDISLRTSRCLRFSAPHYVEGMTVINTYEDSLLINASNLFMEESRFINAGMGFFLDECDMMYNAYNNLCGYVGSYYKRRNCFDNKPVFVVGSGPSLDESIESIRTNKEKAIIISCGSALGILLDNAIRPDFHVELENTAYTPEFLAVTAKSHDISSITLIAAFTVHPDVLQFFKKHVYYFRSNLAPYEIFSLGDDTGIAFSTPTVSNLAFSFAQECGDGDIYLFGVDLGVRSAAQHHAKGSIYQTYEPTWLPEILETTVKANFGSDDVFSDPVFLWAKSSLEARILRNEGAKRNYFNCSDGVWIEGTQPLRATKVCLNEKLVKGNIGERLVESLPKYSEDHFARAWKLKERVTKINRYKRHLMGCVGPEGTLRKNMSGGQTLAFSGNRAERRKALKQNKKAGRGFRRQRSDSKTIQSELRALFEYDFAIKLTKLLENSDESSVEQHFFRGPLFYILRAIHYFSLRIPEGDRREKFIEVGKEEIEKLINFISDETLRLYEKLG
tara:strand:+ start:784 stop:2913 length:2130 start_codon:yes stop_codon:yes gene_type:complete